MPKPQKPKAPESEADQIASKVVEGLTPVLNRIADALAPGKAATVPEGSLPQPRVLGDPAPVATAPAIPIPFEYRQLTESILNKNFGLEIEYFPDSPNFLFSVIVPEKYSSVPPDYRKMYGADKRPKVITGAEGVNGVRNWLELVFNSFNQDVRSVITVDRSNA